MFAILSSHSQSVVFGMIDTCCTLSSKGAVFILNIFLYNYTHIFVSLFFFEKNITSVILYVGLMTAF